MQAISNDNNELQSPEFSNIPIQNAYLKEKKNSSQK